jgi:hypothetical protein
LDRVLGNFALLVRKKDEDEKCEEKEGSWVLKASATSISYPRGTRFYHS